MSPNNNNIFKTIANPQTNTKISDIFVKQSEIKQTQDTVLLKDEILESIPKNYLKNPDSKLACAMIEWRWRFFKLPNKTNEVVEISYKCPSENRKYINNKGSWVERNVDNSFDKFVTAAFYCYSEISKIE